MEKESADWFLIQGLSQINSVSLDVTKWPPIPTPLYSSYFVVLAGE